MRKFILVVRVAHDNTGLEWRQIETRDVGRFTAVDIDSAIIKAESTLSRFGTPIYLGSTCGRIEAKVVLREDRGSRRRWWLFSYSIPDMPIVYRRPIKGEILSAPMALGGAHSATVGAALFFS